jgi:hypothetical protein
LTDPKINERDNFIKIYSNNDEKIKLIGQILTAPKSRKIYEILINKSLNAKEIGKLIDNTENPRLPNLIFHLEKMVKAELLTVVIKLQRKNGHKLKYYSAIPIIMIVPSQYLEKAITSKTLKNVLINIFKLNYN